MPSIQTESPSRRFWLVERNGNSSGRLLFADLVVSIVSMQKFLQCDARPTTTPHGLFVDLGWRCAFLIVAKDSMVSPENVAIFFDAEAVPFAIVQKVSEKCRINGIAGKTGASAGSANIFRFECAFWKSGVMA